MLKIITVCFITGWIIAVGAVNMIQLANEVDGYISEEFLINGK